MDGKLDAKRLEELAVWATTEANAIDYEGSEKASGRLADLARCAAAWAKVERLKITLAPHWAVRVDDGAKYQPCCYGSTAIEAVEAAKEAKP